MDAKLRIVCYNLIKERVIVSTSTLIIQYLSPSSPTLLQNKSVGWAKKCKIRKYNSLFDIMLKDISVKRILVCLLPILPLMMSGCRDAAEKNTSISTVYAIVAILSLLLLIGCFIINKKNKWMLLLFASVLVVNSGYFALSVSGTLEEALFANRISYLGSVFLPLSMLMIILDAVNIRCKKRFAALLVFISICVFLVAASPGYLDIYYKEVSLEKVHGISVLNKVYGPWHRLYFCYLLLHFAAMVAIIAYAIIKKRISSPSHGIILAFAVLVNIGVWLMEQRVKLDFEMLSVSYIISELFLLGLYMMLQEKPAAPNKAAAPAFVPSAAQCACFKAGLPTLTPTERMVYDLFLQGKTTREILDKLNIKENTLKYHNKNLYGKLGVSSRRQLEGIAKYIEK